jgi:hypothetical protein
MIEDLAVPMNKCDRAQGDVTYIRILFPEPAAEKEGDQDRRKAIIGNVRFPCIHNKEPFAFHSVKTLPWKNHVAVPS